MSDPFGPEEQVQYDSGGSPGSSTVLVPLDRVSRHPIAAGPTPDAPFVAHLIATAAHVPQLRTLRRATPEVGDAAYRSTASRSRISMSGRQTRELI